MVGLAIIAVLVVAGTAGAASRWVISNINQIKPSVRQHLRGNVGPQGPQGPAGTAGVVPQIVLVNSETLTLQPNQTSYDVDPNGFQATCPSGDTVLGTGFNGPFGPTGGFVENYGTFVGGFFDNTSSIALSNVYLQATCGQVPSGFTGFARDQGGAETRYHAQLRAAAALR